MLSWLSRSAFSNDFRSSCCSDGSMKISVEAHQIITSRSHSFVRLKFCDVGDQLLGQLHLVGALFDVGAVEPLYVALIEDGLHRLDRLKLGLELD